MRPRDAAQLDTLLVHRPQVPGEPAGASSTPIYQTATFRTDGPGSWDYSRSGNPTRDVLETQLARLDGARRSLAFASGMAALAAVFRLLRPGDRVVAGAELYGGTFRLLHLLAEEAGLEVVHADPRDPPAVAAAVGRRARLVLVESASNPRLRPCDLYAVASVARSRGAWLAVDHSVHSPLLERPLEEGADFAVQSATKLLAGHGDVTAGVVSVADEELGRRLALRRNATGTALAPFDSWLLLRGLETLSVRLERQLTTAGRVVAFLRGHPSVRRAHALDGPGGRPAATAAPLLSFETGSLAASRRVLGALDLFRTTVSFGAVTSSASLPVEMSHASVPEALAARLRLPPDLIRLSIGLEASGDLLADLERALEEAVPRAG